MLKFLLYQDGQIVKIYFMKICKAMCLLLQYLVSCDRIRPDR